MVWGGFGLVVEVGLLALASCSSSSSGCSTSTTNSLGLPRDYKAVARPETENLKTLKRKP